MLRRIPDALSCTRIALSGLFVTCYSSHSRTLYVVSVGLLVLIYVTDLLDGRLARMLGVASRRGSILDGLADRALYIALVLALMVSDDLPTLVAWLILTRELSLYGIRLMRLTPWYPISKRFRRLALSHGIALQAWVFTFILADGLALWKGPDPRLNPHFNELQMLMLALALGLAFYYLFLNVAALVNESSSEYESRDS